MISSSNTGAPRPHSIQLEQPWKHDFCFGNSQNEEISFGFGCDNQLIRFDNEDKKCRKVSLCLDPRNTQPRRGSRREPSCVVSEQSPHEHNDVEFFPSLLRTDALVEVVCSLVDDAIRKHHASLLIPEVGPCGEACGLPSIVPAPTECSNRTSCRSSVKASFKESIRSKNPFVRVHSAHSKASNVKAPRISTGKASAALMIGHTTVEQSKKRAAMKCKASPTLSRVESVAPDRISWRDWLADAVVSSRYHAMFAVALVSNAIFQGITVEISAHGGRSEESLNLFAIGQIYSLFFLLEVLLRITALGSKFFNATDAAWNWFDLLIVTVTTIESTFVIVAYSPGKANELSALHVLRTARVLRVARAFQTFKLFGPLRLLMAGILGTLTSCFWSLVLLIAIIYIFSVTFTGAACQHLYGQQGIDGHSPKRDDTYLYFGTLLRSGDTLFQAICGGVSWGEPLRALGKMKNTGALFVAIFYAYIGFTYFAVLNVVTALFCQFAIESSLTDQKLVLTSKAKEHQYVRHKLQELFRELDEVEQSDESPEGVFTLDELEAFLSKDSVQLRFSVLGVEPEDAWNLFKLLDIDSAGIVDADKFISGCLRLRGDAKRIDISLLMYELEASLTRLDVFMKHVVERLGR